MQSRTTLWAVLETPQISFTCENFRFKARGYLISAGSPQKLGPKGTLSLSIVYEINAQDRGDDTCGAVFQRGTANLARAGNFGHY